MLLEMKQISKSFNSVSVLHNVDFSVARGEIHALVGENGAGKSTLMKILTGVYTKDSGDIFFNGKKITIENVRESEQLDIAIIHQELNVLGEMTIAENLFLGREKTKTIFRFLDKKSMDKKASELLHKLGLSLSPHTLVKNLSVGQAQLCEIAKALLLDAKLIVMDEPTAALTEKESTLLFSIVRKLRDNGVSFVYISHRLEEIFLLCDSLSVLRDGKKIAQMSVKDATVEKVISLMVGYDIDDRFPRIETNIGRVMLEAKKLSSKGKFYNVNFQVHAGEVFCFAGLMGSGRTELMHALFGSEPATSGEIFIDGKKVSITNPRCAKKLKLGFVTEDRKNEGLILQESVLENMTLSSLKDFSKKCFVLFLKAKKNVLHFVEKLFIKTPSTEIPVSCLSGGNQQKIVIAKWLMTKPKILILDEPTRGVDVGAKREIYKIINELKADGVAIIVVSSELPEVLGIADRCAVMCNKTISKILLRSEMTQEKIMRYAVEGDGTNG